MADDLGDVIAAIWDELERLARIIDGGKRTGLVLKKDVKRGLIKGDLGGGVETRWSPVQELAMGGMKTRFLPDVGEQVDFISATGDMTDSYVSMSIPSDKNPMPQFDHDDDRGFTMGDMTFTFRAGQIKAKVGDSVLLIEAGQITLKSKKLVIDGEIVAKGDWTQDGIHTDKAGKHA